ncbi:MAG: hypothetical protein Q4B09_07020 [Lachnospiraceae bacterium]|nr:hypothetical protein [Lachnospiraceae bacterium]
MGKYDQIINLERPVDKKHPPMSIHNRAAQFAPFDALTGFSGRIYETSRLTSERIELTEDVRQVINDSLRQIEAHIKEQPEVTVTYFLPDKRKDGGSYPTVTARVLKMDTYDERLRLEDDISIAFDDIVELIMHPVRRDIPDKLHL